MPSNLSEFIQSQPLSTSEKRRLKAVAGLWFLLLTALVTSAALLMMIALPALSIYGVYIPIVQSLYALNFLTKTLGINSLVSKGASLISQVYPTASIINYVKNNNFISEKVEKFKNLKNNIKLAINDVIADSAIYQFLNIKEQPDALIKWIAKKIVIEPNKTAAHFSDYNFEASVSSILVTGTSVGLVIGLTGGIAALPLAIVGATFSSILCYKLASYVSLKLTKCADRIIQENPVASSVPPNDRADEQEPAAFRTSKLIGLGLARTGSGNSLSSASTEASTGSSATTIIDFGSEGSSRYDDKPPTENWEGDNNTHDGGDSNFCSRPGRAVTI